MGIIEDAILTTYKKALTEGKLDQATRLVEFAKNFKEFVENKGLMDDSQVSMPYTPKFTFFNQFPYRYYPNERIVVINGSAIILTKRENQLFKLFSDNESTPEKLQIINTVQIRKTVWRVNSVSKNAIRIALMRLRRRLASPSIVNFSPIISIYSSGYIFIGKMEKDTL